MPRERSWSDQQLVTAVARSFSYRQVIRHLGLIPAGGNYVHVLRRITELNMVTDHFTGKRWSAGKTYHNKSRADLTQLLTNGSKVQSFKLKKRLYETGSKFPQCEICGWAEMSEDGRIPVELDHINGDRYDNRIENLRILCPNCHSLQLTHRGKNKKVSLRNLTK